MLKMTDKADKLGRAEFRVRHVPHEAHIWVMEQAELGERTDYKQGLPECRIEAAEKAFVAGWRASLFAKGKQQ